MSYLTSPLESATRKRLDALLENLGWDCEERSATCNVFTERDLPPESSLILM